MDATQLIALQAASTRLTTAQAASQQATTAVSAAETAAATAATANPVVPADFTAANATVTQARVAVLIAINEVEAATAAVNALMVKPAKAFKPHGQAPPFDMEGGKTHSTCGRHNGEYSLTCQPLKTWSRCRNNQSIWRRCYYPACHQTL